MILTFFVEVGRIQGIIYIHIIQPTKKLTKKLTKKSLKNKFSKMLLEIECNNHNSIKSKALKYIVKKNIADIKKDAKSLFKV